MGKVSVVCMASGVVSGAGVLTSTWANPTAARLSAGVYLIAGLVGVLTTTCDASPRTLGARYYGIEIIDDNSFKVRLFAPDGTTPTDGEFSFLQGQANV